MGTEPQKPPCPPGLSARDRLIWNTTWLILPTVHHDVPDAEPLTDALARQLIRDGRISGMALVRDARSQEDAIAFWSNAEGLLVLPLEQFDPKEP